LPITGNIAANRIPFIPADQSPSVNVSAHLCQILDIWPCRVLLSRSASATLSHCDVEWDAGNEVADGIRNSAVWTLRR